MKKKSQSCVKRRKNYETHESVVNVEFLSKEAARASLPSFPISSDHKLQNPPRQAKSIESEAIVIKMLT